MFYATHNLHANKNGVFEGIEFSKEIQKYLIQKNIYKNLGDKVEFFDNASKALGIVFLKFDSKNSMLTILQKIDQHITVKIR